MRRGTAPGGANTVGSYAAAVLECDGCAIRLAIHHHRLIQKDTPKGLLPKLMTKRAAVPLVP